MAYRGTCPLCHEAVTSEHRAGYRVRGWEMERSGGGPNHIHDKERQPNRIWHAVCLEARLASSKYGGEQMAL